MSRKLAVKRLTQSDLTLFEWQFKNHNAGNQKAINLNRNVFINELYPILPELAGENDGRFPLDLQIFGPGTSVLHNLQRKIIKNDTYKNWRLNGEFIYNPDDNPTRYNVLRPGDLAIFEFYGIDKPKSAKIVLLAEGLPGDQTLIARLNDTLGDRAMIAINSLDIEKILTELAIPQDHPSQELVVESELEEAIYSGDIDVGKIIAKPSLRRVSKEDFSKAKKSAEENGAKGELFVNAYLEQKTIVGEIGSYKWASNENPILPYDFAITAVNNTTIYIDVKTTEGRFETDIYISYNELKQMLHADRYDLYRIYCLEENTAKLRICENVRQFSECILQILNGLPPGVKSSGVSVFPGILHFGAEGIIDLPLNYED